MKHPMFTRILREFIIYHNDTAYHAKAVITGKKIQSENICKYCSVRGTELCSAEIKFKDINGKPWGCNSLMILHEDCMERYYLIDKLGTDVVHDTRSDDEKELVQIILG